MFIEIVKIFRRQLDIYHKNDVFLNVDYTRYVHGHCPYVVLYNNNNIFRPIYQSVIIKYIQWRNGTERVNLEE